MVNRTYSTHKDLNLLIFSLTILVLFTMVLHSKICCRWYCQAHPPTDEGTERQEKLGSCRTAVVVVAPAITSRSSCWTCQVVDNWFPNKEAEHRGGKRETYNENRGRVRAQGVQGRDRQAKRTATLSLALCVLLLLLLLLCC